MIDVMSQLIRSPQSGKKENNKGTVIFRKKIVLLIVGLSHTKQHGDVTNSVGDILIHVLMGNSLVTQSIKNMSAVQETRAQSLGQEDPLEKEMVTHSSILSWNIPWTEDPGWL